MAMGKTYRIVVLPGDGIGPEINEVFYRRSNY
jgi:isocitrate/isopropylmalate dehydrogenase